MIAYSYIRWSSEVQTQGDSLRRQLEITRKICAEKKWKLDESLRPDTASAFTAENIEKGSLASFLRAIESGKIKTPCVLVVEALDRLTRTRLRDARKLFEGLLEKNVKICTANNGKVYDESSLDNPIDMLMSMMDLKAANDYSANIGRRVGEAWTRKKKEAQSGKLLTRRVPSWIQVDEATEKRTIIEDKAEIIRRIFREYLAGKGARLIGLDLNKEGIPNFGTGKGAGKGWSSTPIKRYLTSVSVIGSYQPCKYVGKGKSIPDGPAVENYYPAILDKTTFYAVQRRMKERRTTRGARKHVFNLFSGLIRCKHCGERIVIKAGAVTKIGKKEPWVTLLCSKAQRGKGCQYRTMKYKQFERGILTALWLRVLVSSIKPDTTKGSTLRLKQGELTHVKAKIAELKKQAIQLTSIPANYLELLNQLESRERDLVQEIELIPVEGSNGAIQSWEQVPNDIQNRLRIQGVMSDAIKCVTLDPIARKAVMQLRESDSKMSLSWNDKAKDGFLLAGHWQPYLDDVLVWKSDKNIKMNGRTVKLIDTDMPVLFGVELEPNKIAIAA